MKQRCAFLLLLFFSSGLALFADQAGLFDWKQDYVGNIKEFHWEQSPTTGKKILVASDKNLIASINANDGSIAWRRIFEPSARGKIDAFLYHGSSLVSIHAGGQFVRSWQVLFGSLLWEKSLRTDSDSRASAFFVMKNGKADQLIVATSSAMHCLRMSDGNEDWKVALPSSDTVENWHIKDTGNHFVAVGISPGQRVTTAIITPDGEQHSNVPAPWIARDSSCVITEDSKHFVCYSQATRSLQLLSLDNPKVFIPTNLKDLNIDVSSEAGIEMVVPELGSTLLFRSAADNLVFLSLNAQQSFTVYKTLPKTFAAKVVTYSEKPIVLALSRLDAESLQLNAYDLQTDADISDISMTIPFAHYHGNPNKMYPFLFAKRKDSSNRPGCKLVFSAQDYSLHFAQKSRPAWRREESLAYIQAVQMVDLPVSENQAKFEDEFGAKEEDILAMFLKRLKAQFSQLKGLVKHIKAKLQGVNPQHEVNMDAIEEEEPSEEDLIRDDFNLHKIIVVATASGKIYGIRSHTGKIAWQQFIPDLSPFNRHGNQKLLLMTQRTTAHFPHEPLCTVLGVSRTTGNGLVVSVNPVSGHTAEGHSGKGYDVGFKVIQAEMLAEMDEDFLKRIVLIDDKFKAHIFPPSSPGLVSQFQMQLFFHLVDPDTGTMRGFRLIQAPNSKELTIEEIWNLDLQKSQQTVTGVYGKRALEHVHSQGRVLGDRSVLYKYLNPNMVAVVTEGEEAAVASSSKGPSSFFCIYLIDGVTGHIVYHQTHKKSRGPIKLIHSENWIVYSYFSDKHRRNEVAVLELFEGKEQSNSTAFSSFTPPPPPVVLRQSYVFPEPVYAMEATLTEKGITSKNIIMALKIGGILSLPKALLDPRRPAIPTQETHEEGTIPYVPEIPLSTEALVNYNQSVFNVEGIYTSPAGLESTSLVFVYGVDIFYTRVMPSRMFDVLKEDFDYLFIGSVLAVMILVSFITQRLAARKALNRAWK